MAKDDKSEPGEDKPPEKTSDGEKPESEVAREAGQAAAKTLTRKIATTIRERAGASPLSQLREYAMPILTLGLLVVILASFRTVLLPFIFACVLVYLMEPIVKRIGRSPHDQRGIPRWMAVIAVYIVFIGVLTTSLLLVVPRFITEIVRFAETAPEAVHDFRKEELPGINKNLQDFVRSYLPAAAPSTNFEPVRSRILEAREAAARNALAAARVREAVRIASGTEVGWRLEDPGDGSALRQYVIEPAPDRPMPFSLEDSLDSDGWRYDGGDDQAALRLLPEKDGSIRVFMSDVAMEVQRTGEDSWLVRKKRSDSVPVRGDEVALEELFNLEKRLDEVVEELVTTSNERLTSLIEFAQKLLVGIVGAFVGIVLTLMVAAFISIDLPRVMAFLRGLVPREARHGYDILLKNMDRGLAGVVRGQLMICVVNGVLTYIGLAILGVKFSVLLAVVAGILSLIPVFGTIISTVPIVLVGLTSGLMTGVLALGWILLIHFVEANILNPKIIGTSAHIHPVIVIFALLAGESAYGLVGALLAVPTASILLTLFDFVRTKAWKVEGPQPAE